VAPDEVGLLRAIERLTRQKVPSEDRRANPTVPLNERATPVRQQRSGGGGRGGQQPARGGKPSHAGGGRSDGRNEARSYEPRGESRGAERSYVKPAGDAGRKRPGNDSGRSFMARGR
jgi:ATP-dependent RNA helicase RhlE